MRVSYTTLLLLPLVLAHEPAVPAYRRHHARAVIDANRVPNVARAGGVIDDGTLASISTHDAASASATQSAILSASTSAAVAASASATSSAAQDDDEDPVSTSATASSAVDSGVAGGAPSSTASSAVASSTTSSAVLSETETSSSVAETASSTISSAAAPPTSTIADVVPSTLSSVAVIPSAIDSGTAHSTIVLVTTASRTSASHTSSATSESSQTEEKKSGLGKTALIAIIVVASVVGLSAIGWTLFRKWKLRPSNRFDKRMNPIDFSPQNNTMDDDFFEKTLQRTASNSSASRQRRELVAELDDPNGVPGVPPHDFTAGTAGVGAGVGAGYNMYNQDPYSHAEQYEYDQGYDSHGQHGQYDQHQYPPQAHSQDAHGYATYAGGPTQDQPLNDGYADLQRGGSIGSGSGHGHAIGYQHPQAVSHGLGHDQNVYPGELNFPTADQYGGLGRPTGGAEGPYAQAAQYRGY